MGTLRGTCEGYERKALMTSGMESNWEAGIWSSAAVGDMVAVVMRFGVRFVVLIVGM